MKKKMARKMKRKKLSKAGTSTSETVDVKQELDLTGDEMEVDSVNNEETQIAAPKSLLSSSDILDMVLTRNADAPTVNTPTSTAAGIAANFLQAVKSAKLSRSTDTGRGKRQPVKPVIKRVTPSRRAAVQAKNAIPVSSNSSKAPRVIGKEVDIRNQLLSKFTEVAAAKSALNGNTARKRHSCPSQIPAILAHVKSKTTERTKAPTSSSQGQGSSSSFSNTRAKAKPSSPPPKRTTPRVHLNLVKPGKQNIAFADPVRKVAGVVETMFSSAITKVLAIPPSENLKRKSLPQLPMKFSMDSAPPTEKSSTRVAARSAIRAASRTQRNKHRKCDDSSDDEDESTLAQDKPWESEDNDDSNSYEETPGNFDADSVKVEIVSEEQETEFDYDSRSNTIRLDGHQVIDMNDEEDQDEDPLSISQSEVDGSGAAIIKMEDAGMDTALEGEHPTDKLDNQLFGGQNACDFEGEEPEQVTVDVKPEFLPVTETGEDCSVTISNVETLVGDKSTEADPLLTTLVKTEVLDPEGNDCKMNDAALIPKIKVDYHYKAKDAWNGLLVCQNTNADELTDDMSFISSVCTFVPSSNANAHYCYML